MGTLFDGPTGEKLRKIIVAAVAMLVLFLAFEAISVAFGLPFIGQTEKLSYTITVDGHGEVLAVPNIATFSFSVVSDKPTVAEAQTDEAQVANAVTQYLTSQGVSTNDIQTTDYEVSPQYENQQGACPLVPGNSGAVVYCPPGQQVLKGYEVSQQTTVKVRDTTKAGTLIAGVGTQGATEVSGLTFTSDNPEVIQQQAQQKAIADAEAQAQVLAKSLGVSLGRLTAFYDNNTGGGPEPVTFSANSGGMARAAVAPDISVGQNDITDDVSLTFEIH